MEAIFIKKIYKLTEQIFRGNYEYDAMETELKRHLNKAQSMNSDAYEIEVLNTLGILYSSNEQSTLQEESYRTALQKAKQIEHTDLITKLSNNLASHYLGTWRMQEARDTLQVAVDIIEVQENNSLPVLYVYANFMSTLMIAGRFDDALAYHERAWTVANNVDMGGYSQTEYMQIVTTLRHQKVALNIARGTTDSVPDTLRAVMEQVQISKRDDLAGENRLYQLYYARLVTKDDAEADTLEASLRDDSGLLDPAVALNCAYFMFHNNSTKWAKYYAEMVTARHTMDASQVNENMLSHAQKLLAKIDESAEETT
ncbi:MAG: hypothetical protein AAFV98_07685 [Chloroflexota bacterium]